MSKEVTFRTKVKNTASKKGLDQLLDRLRAHALGEGWRFREGAYLVTVVIVKSKTQ
jgi:hypothetical protein